MKTSYSFIALTIFAYSHVFSADQKELEIPEPFPSTVAKVSDIGSRTLLTKGGTTTESRMFTSSEEIDQLLKKTDYYEQNPDEWRKAYLDYNNSQKK